MESFVLLCCLKYIFFIFLQKSTVFFQNLWYKCLSSFRHHFSQLTICLKSSSFDIKLSEICILTNFEAGFTSLFPDLDLKNEAFSTEILQTANNSNNTTTLEVFTMKHLKKLLALFLAMVLATSFATTAMAAETENEIPENATRHTIELTVAADGTIESDDEYGIAPLIWNQENYTVSGNKTYTLQFTVPDRYFAYELTATDTSGNTLSSTYKVDLLLAVSFSTIASCCQYVDGVTYKVDNIDLSSSNQTCLFCITNYTGTPISVTLTYYSWA